jgi:molybdate transport system ATP-binding protein
VPTAALDVALRTTLRHGASRAFDLDVAFSSPPGVTILFGPSGSGKTTILECLAGLLRPNAGRVVLNERPLFDAERRIDVPVPQRRVGYVFQNLALFPHLSVEQNIGYGLRAVSPGERRARIEKLAAGFHITDLLARRPAEISGGERQRTALARALITDPQLLLLDEPMSALDHATKTHIMDDLRAWNEASRIPIIYVTHGRREVFALGERVVVLGEGRVIAQGTPREVLEAPRHEATARLAGCENILDATVVSIHEAHATMQCRMAGSPVELEVPLYRHAAVGQSVRIGIHAGEIMVATAPPNGLSARNVFETRVVGLEERPAAVLLSLDCGILLQAKITPGACEALDVAVGRSVWAVLKTHSCHVFEPA